MNSFDKKIQTRLRMHPEMLRNLLASPSQEAIETLTRYQSLNPKRPISVNFFFLFFPNGNILPARGVRIWADLFEF
jgi:hypothetical protein